MIHSIILVSVLFYALPTITNYPSIRNVGNLGPVISDTESHLPANLSCLETDVVGTVHYGTHFIHSELREKFRKPCFYVLRNRVVILPKEPATTLTRVSRLVPVSLRGKNYSAYLIESRRWWENQPSYIFDEWVAYTNGSEARWRHAYQPRIDTVKTMIEFCVYSTCVPWSSKSTDPRARAFIMWQIERSMMLLRKSHIRSAYLDRLRKSADATELRVYMRDYFGLEFTRKVMGF